MSARPIGYTNRKVSKAEFFLARVLFKGVRILVEKVRNIQLFKYFNLTCSILANLPLKGGSIGFFRVDTSQL